VRRARPRRRRCPPALQGPAADEKLHCFLTEARARFCAANLKRKATADVINYFKGIEYTNRRIVARRQAEGDSADGRARRRNDRSARGRGGSKG
jgi:hypothetical protein